MIAINIYKKNVIYFYLFALLMIAVFISCDSEKPTEPPVTYGDVYGIVVYAETEFPIPGVIVSIENMMTTTNSSGQYTIRSIETGTKTIKATHNEFNDYAQSLTIAQGDNEFNISLFPKGEPYVSGIVTNSLNQPIRNASVQVGDASEITDADGKFKVIGVKPGENNLIVSIEHFEKYEHSFTMPLTGSMEFSIKLSSLILPQITSINHRIIGSEGIDAVEVTWKLIDKPTVLGYRIFRSVASISTPGRCQMPWSNWEEIGTDLITDNKYIDRAVHRYNHWYRYYILPVNIDGDMTEYNFQSTKFTETQAKINSIPHDLLRIPPIEPRGPVDLPHSDGDLRFVAIWDYDAKPTGCAVILLGDVKWRIEISTNKEQWISLGDIEPVSSWEAQVCWMYNLDSYKGMSLYWRVSGDTGPLNCSTFSLAVYEFIND